MIIDNLVSYFALNDDADDAHGDNHGSPLNVSFAPGILDNGAVFNNINSKIDFGLAGLPSGGGARSVSGWIKIVTPGAWDGIVGWGSASGGAGFYVCLNGDGNKITIGGYGGNASASSATPLSPGVLYHVGVKWVAGNIVYYLNGVPDGTATLALNTVLTSARIGKAIPGWDGVDGNYVFSGVIDELGIWSRGLSNDEFLALYNDGDGYAYPLDRLIAPMPSFRH